MRKRRSPSATYFELAYIQLAVTLVCAVILLATGNVLEAGLLLAAVAVLFAWVTKYRSRTHRSRDVDDR